MGGEKTKGPATIVYSHIDFSGVFYFVFVVFLLCCSIFEGLGSLALYKVEFCYGCHFSFISMLVNLSKRPDK